MSKVILTVATILVLFSLSACASFKEPPAVIYPDPQESPGNYRIDR